MRAPSAAELLEVWETGLSQAPTERALALLAACQPQVSWEALAALSIGLRDAELLKLREALWGPRMTGQAACPSCHEKLELSLDTQEILATSPATLPGEMTLRMSEFTMTFRLPTSLDLLDLPGQGDQERCRTLILKRCLLTAEHGGAPVGVDGLPPDVVAGIAKCMSDTDPLADLQLDLTCPTCEHRWRVVFDIVSFLWTEIEAWASRILSEVHTLAQAYGWRERDILALSPTRRQFYLEMVRA
jgi:hypothetical protein